jgi:hypothetical protein
MTLGRLFNRHRGQVGDGGALLFVGESVPDFRFCHIDHFSFTLILSRSP